MATSKKHAFGHKEGEKFISASRRYSLKHDRTSTYMASMVAFIEHTHKNAGLAEAKLHWSGLPILVPECIELG